MLYDHAAERPQASDAAVPRINYEPIAPGHGIQWALARGVSWMVMAFALIIAGAVVYFMWSLVSLFVTGPLLIGVYVALRTLGANHAHHLAYHSAVVEQMQPRVVVEALAAPPTLEDPDVAARRDMLYTLAARAIGANGKQGDPTIPRSTDTIMTREGREITHHLAPALYDELRSLGILAQDSRGRWQAACDLTTAFERIRVTYG